MLCFNFSDAQKSIYKYDNNLSIENNELLKKALEIEEIREQRILAYLLANPEVKRYVSINNGGAMAIVDIMEGKPLYISTDNSDAAKATGVTHLNPGGSLGLNLDGSGMTIAIWDEGPAQNDHPEFMDATDTQSRISVIDNTTVSDHGTHVTGIISAKGVNPLAKGMAPNVTVLSYDFSNDSSEIISAVTNPTDPIILSNHSYGFPVVNQNNGDVSPSWFMGTYGSYAQGTDDLHYNNPYYLMVTSAGNSGTDSYPNGLLDGFDKLTGHSTAKNNLVIANASPVFALFSDELSSLTIHFSSSEGPTDDLRVKPDIAADGTGLLSTYSGGNYASLTGTSMSSPNTTGALVLLQQYYEHLHGVYMKSASLKGLVCHTSRDDIANIGPDPMFGWGFLNALEAVITIADANTDGNAIIDELNLSQGAEYTLSFSAVAGDKIKATICWTDIAGLGTSGQLNNQTPKLVNDLDLRITKDGTTYEPWKLDFSSGTAFTAIKGDNTVDNIEIVEIDNFETGDYTITVSHKGTLQGNTGGPFDPQSQDFSLILSGNNLSLGIDDESLSNAVSVFPNPFNEEFYLNIKLTSNEETKIRITDLNGRVVLTDVVSSYMNQLHKINMSQFQSGVYLLSLENGVSKYNTKIIKN